MTFQHLPAQSLEDVTANLEQLQRLIARIKLIPIPRESVASNTESLKELLELLRAF